MARQILLALGVVLALTLHVTCNKAVNEPISFTSFFENLNSTFQNATHAMEDILGVDIPSTRDEMKTALQDNLNSLKESAQNLQQKLKEYSENGTTFSGVLEKVQTQVNETVEGLAQRNPDAGKLLTQLKSGYNSLVDVSKRVQDVVEQQAGSASDDLKNLAQQARTELSKAATNLESKVQEVLAENKKSKTS